MSVIWSGLTEEGAVVPVQVTEEGKVVVTANRPVDPTDGGGASAWGRVDDNGVLENGLNIASVTRTGTGDYDVVFTTPMPNSFYAVVGSIARNSGATCRFGNQSATGFTVKMTSYAGNPENQPFSFAVFATNALPPKGGTGTDAWGSVQEDGTVDASFNVASVTRASTGSYNVVFITTMPTASYSVVATNNKFDNQIAHVINKATGGFTVVMANDGNQEQDAPFDFQVNATDATLPTTFTRAQIQKLLELAKRMDASS